jgi:Tol biopolymer transport system component
VSLRHSPGISGHKMVQASGSLVIRSLETGEEREIIIKSPAVARYPSWSPNGRYILCAADPHGLDNPSRRSPGHFSLIDVQTGHVTFIMERDFDRRFLNWQWSPDGKSIFYTSRRKGSPSSIVVYNRETDKEKELCQDAGSSGFAVSPDGQQLALAGNGGRALKVMQIDGGEDRELLQLQDRKWFAGGSDPFNSFAWTADGRYVLFRLREYGDELGPLELWLVSAEGGEPQKLLAMVGLRDISVHPDGRRIVFTCGGYHTMEVWAMENFLPGFTTDK